MISMSSLSEIGYLYKKLEKESVVCLSTALFLKNRFQWQTTDQYKAQRRAHSPFNITKERDEVLRKAAVKTTGVESLCSATTRISWVLWVVVSLVNFKTERETKNLCFRHIFIYLPIIFHELILLSNKHFTIGS